MPRKTPRLLKALRTADDVCRITTGRRLNEVAANVIEFFGEDFLGKAASKEEDIEEINRKLPYITLGVNPDCPNVVLRASYKAMIKECHPDGAHPDTEKASRINLAYEDICKQRGIPK